jgi:hypothetical protein
MKALVFSKSVTALEFQRTSSTAFSDHHNYEFFEPYNGYSIYCTAT